MKKTLTLKIIINLKFHLVLFPQKTISKTYVDNKYNNATIIKNICHAEFNNKYFDNVRFFKISSYPAVGEHLTATYHVDEAITNSLDELSMLRIKANQNLILD